MTARTAERAPTLTDAALTEAGLPAARRGRVLLLACGALAREILALVERNGWDHLDLMCLPAILHNTPERIPEAVRAAVTEHRPRYDSIHVVYADCGTGGRLQELCKEMGVDMVEGPHCYSFLEGNDSFAARAEDEFTAFYLTDFLVRQFDAFVWKPLGLDRHPQLREAYFGNYDRLVYLAQTEDEALTEKAKTCADRLGLAFERRATGYGDLAGQLRNWAARG
jgi:hypothetical protein